MQPKVIWKKSVDKLSNQSMIAINNIMPKFTEIILDNLTCYTCPGMKSLCALERTSTSKNGRLPVNRSGVVVTIDVRL